MPKTENLLLGRKSQSLALVRSGKLLLVRWLVLAKTVLQIPSYHRKKMTNLSQVPEETVLSVCIVGVIGDVLIPFDVIQSQYLDF